MDKKTLFLASLAAFLVPTAFASAQTLEEMAGRIEGVAVGIATPIVIIGWIIAGILFLTSAGSPEKMGTAKKATFAAVIGTVLVVLAVGGGAIINVVADAFGL